METIPIKGNARTGLGKKDSKELRRQGGIPCVIYGGENVVHFSTTALDVRHMIYTPDFKVAEIEVDGSTYRGIVKDVQYHPVTDAIVHIDFLELVEGKPIRVEIPVRMTGVSPGIKSGGILQQKLRKVQVKTTPEHLVDQMLIDISTLELDHSIRVRDIETEEGIEIMNIPGIPVASVVVPRALKSATEIEEEESEEGLEEGEGEEGAEGGEGDTSKATEE